MHYMGRFTHSQQNVAPVENIFHQGCKRPPMPPTSCRVPFPSKQCSTGDTPAGYNRCTSKSCACYIR
eukprot:6348584-Ditylum_brightwellii.AAC.2